VVYMSIVAMREDGVGGEGRGGEGRGGEGGTHSLTPIVHDSFCALCALIVAMLASKTDLRIADSCSSYTLLKSCNEEMGEPTEGGGGGGSDTMRWWW
jgi:hypothetical protein